MRKYKNTIIAISVCFTVMIFAAFVPKMVNILFMTKIFPSADDLQNPEWLDFWGSYLGGLLGSVAALFALVLNIWQQDKYRENTETDNRLRVMPAVTCRLTSKPQDEKSILSYIAIQNDWSIRSHTSINYDTFLKSRSEYASSRCVYLKIDNIGLGPAFEVFLFADKINKQQSTYLGNLSIGSSTT